MVLLNEGGSEEDTLATVGNCLYSRNIIIILIITLSLYFKAGVKTLNVLNIEIISINENYLV